MIINSKLVIVDINFRVWNVKSHCIYNAAIKWTELMQRRNLNYPIKGSPCFRSGAIQNQRTTVPNCINRFDYPWSFADLAQCDCELRTLIDRSKILRPNAFRSETRKELIKVRFSHAGGIYRITLQACVHRTLLSSKWHFSTAHNY